MTTNAKKIAENDARIREIEAELASRGCRDNAPKRLACYARPKAQGFIQHNVKPSYAKPTDKPTGQHVEVLPGKSIRLFGTMERWVNGKTELVAYNRTFRIGDMVEVDSFNLTYHGKIVAIGGATVTTEHPHHEGKTRRLSFYQFSWRNRDLNLAENYRRNSEWMD